MDASNTPGPDAAPAQRTEQPYSSPFADDQWIYKSITLGGLLVFILTMLATWGLAGDMLLPLP